ncbi:MAG: hypothetical protein AB7N91_11185 [Candidatus Tectimicrobiota bacterium]
MLLRYGVFWLGLLLATPGVWSEEAARTSLFKIITVKDEIIIGLNAAELGRLDGQDAGAVARALAASGTLTVWQYHVQRGPNGALQQAPRQKVGILAHSSLRVEPYTTPYAIVPHQ